MDLSGVLRDVKEFVLSFKLCLVAAISTLIFLLLPDSWAQAVGVVGLRREVEPWVGAVAILAVAGVLMHLGSWAFDHLRHRRATSQRKAQMRNAIKTLSAGEGQVLLYCFIKGQRSINLPVDYPPANSLQSKRLLIMAGGMINVLHCAHTIPEDAWDLIQEELPALMGSDSAEVVSRASWFRRLDRGQTDWQEFVGH